jgi:hypothetical protein
MNAITHLPMPPYTAKPPSTWPCGSDMRRAVRAINRPPPQPDHDAARAVLSSNATADDLETLEFYACED